MLRILRNKKTAKKVWIGLAIIIIPAFSLWGFGGAFRNKEDTAVVGKIYGHKVSNLEFKESLSAVKTAALVRFGDTLPEIEKYLNLETQAWQRLILLHEARARKITVSDKEIIDTIQGMPFFRDKNGFSNKAYIETLRYVFKLQPRIYEEQMRQNLILGKLYEQVTASIKLSDELVRKEYLKINQELNIQYIGSLFSEFAAKIKPTDQEINSFFEKNKAMFKAPPTKDIATRIPELSEIKDKVKEALIKEESKKMASNKIKECEEKLKNLDFKRAAVACGLKISKTAFFKSSGQIENLGAAEIFWNTAKGLKDKELSTILSNEKGYYIIKLGSIKPIDEAKFAKEKKEFGEKLLSEKKNKIFDNFTEGLVKKAQ